MRGKTKQPVEILLIEDNPGDILLTQEAFAELETDYRLNVVTNGEEAIDFLQKQGTFKVALTPDLILLDLNLPRRNGIEVLDMIKHDEELRKIPVVILTVSNSKRDVLNTYGHYANCFITKPLYHDEFVDTIKFLERFWLNTAKLPTRIAKYY